MLYPNYLDLKNHESFNLLILLDTNVLVYQNEYNYKWQFYGVQITIQFG